MKEQRMRVIRCALAGLFLVLFACVASAQTVASPTGVEFDSLDHALQDNGVDIVTHYVVELWTPGSDTVVGGPTLQSPEIAKSVATTVASTTPGVPRVRLTVAAFGFAIPPGTTWVVTIRAKGTGGSARSAASNPFSFPILGPRAPRAPTNVVMVNK